MKNSWLQWVSSVLKVIIADIEKALAAVGTEIWHIVQEVFKAEEQVIMAEFYILMRQVAVDLQNTKPGMNSKDFFAQLEIDAIKVLAGMGKTIAWTAIATTIATVLHDLNIPDTTGNQGVVTT